jgi:sugar fermentation stimulation protein A
VSGRGSLKSGPGQSVPRKSGPASRDVASEAPDGLDCAAPGHIKIDFPPLTEGRLIKRHHRFLADVELSSGALITAHTNNTGAMLDCSEPGRPVYLSYHGNPGRSYPYAWELIEMPDSLVGVNTLLPNRLAALAAASGALTGGLPPAAVRREVKVGQSRLDLGLVGEDGEMALVEVKSATLVRSGVAMFPDAVSQRGAKHLYELSALSEAGRRAILLVLVQRGGGERFSPADDIDPAWGAALRQAVDRGVELFVRQVDLDLSSASWGRALPASL